VLARDRGRDVGIVFDAIGAREHIDRDGFLDRLAGIAGFEQRQFIVAGAEDIDRAAQDAARSVPVRRATAAGRHAHAQLPR
jgi:hypothetical protein